MRFCLLVSLDPQKFDYGFASAQDDRLQVILWFADSSSTAAAVPFLPQEKATKSHAHGNKFLKCATRLCGYAQT